MDNKNKLKNFEQNLLKKSVEIEGISIKGYDFNEKLDYSNYPNCSNGFYRNFICYATQTEVGCVKVE